MKKILVVGAAFLLSGGAWAGKFDEPASGGMTAGPVRVGGLLDVRYAYTSQEKGWLRGSPGYPGTNKLRYGGRDTDGDGKTDRQAHLFTIPQVSLLLDARVLPSANVHVHANAGADPEVPATGLGIVEAYADIEQAWNRHAFRFRGGAFFPPISWEHPGPAWSTRYTLTPSAIGAWVGEDVRTLGVEGTWQINLGRHWLRGSGGPVWGSDQTGWVLMERGWAIHDYQSDLRTKFPLPNGEFDGPFQEIDGKPGHTWRVDASVLDDLLQVGGGHWGNHAQPDAVFVGSHFDAYRTWAEHFGAKLSWRGATLLGQYLYGGVTSKTYATLFPALPERTFYARYGLASYQWHRWRATGRYEEFQVEKWEQGRATTAAVSYDVGPRQRVTLEYIRAQADPTVPRFRTNQTDTSQTDSLVQLNHRFTF